MNAEPDFGQVEALVLGDVMLDEYVWGEVRRISPEAPVPIVEVRSEPGSRWRGERGRRDRGARLHRPI